MSENLPAKKEETSVPAPKAEQKASLTRRELLQKAGWIVPAVAIVGLTRSARPEQIRRSLS